MIFSTDKNISESGIILYLCCFVSLCPVVDSGDKGCSTIYPVNLDQQTQMHKTCAFLAPSGKFLYPLLVFFYRPQGEGNVFSHPVNRG